ncbi:MAG: hypothetical protein WDW36_007751 [Sanguina aurantia]
MAAADGAARSRSSTPASLGGVLPLSFQYGKVVATLHDGETLPLLHLTSLCNSSSLTTNAAASTEGMVVVAASSVAGSAATLVDIQIGQVKFSRALACSRCKVWWMGPQWFSSTTKTPPATQFLLLELKPGGPYALMLPLVCGASHASLRSAREEGDLTLRVESAAPGAPPGSEIQWPSILLLAASWDPFELVDRGVTAAAAVLSGGARPRMEKQLPETLDLFGWCTWDAFYREVSALGISQGLTSFAEGGVSPRYLILDDGWQVTDVDPCYRASGEKDCGVPDMGGRRSAQVNLERSC